MKPAILATDPGDVTQNWVLFGSQRTLLRGEEGDMLAWEQAVLDAQEHYSKKAGLVCIIESFIMYPGVTKLYQRFWTAENIGVMQYICAREQIPVVFQKPGERKIISDDFLKIKGLWVKNQHIRQALKHALVYQKREAAGRA